MNYQSLPELINQAQQLMTQIRQHPNFKALNYSPDVTIADAYQALNELRTEISETPNLDVLKMEKFNQ
jgi:hypothetical protein